MYRIIVEIESCLIIDEIDNHGDAIQKYEMYKLAALNPSLLVSSPNVDAIYLIEFIPEENFWKIINKWINP